MDRLRDLFIGSTLLCLSLASAGFSYSAIAAQEQAQESWISRYLIDGAQSYSLKSNAQCIGGFSLTVDPRHTPSLEFKGNVRASLNGMESTPQLEGTITLNPLLQVNGANFKVSAHKAQLTVTSINVNPIEITVQGNGGGKSLSRTFSVPGPITLAPLKNGRYTFEGPALRAGNNPLATHITQLLLQDINLSTEPQSPSELPCGNAGTVPADITPMVQRIEALIPNWMKEAVSNNEFAQGVL